MNRIIYLTGFYGQMIAVQTNDILQIIPHRVWTEMVIAGGQEIKVMETQEEIRKKIEEAENDSVSEKPEDNRG